MDNYEFLRAMLSMKSYDNIGDQVHLSALSLIKDGSVVLSCGCGSGREVKELVRKKCFVTAIDMREIMIHESKKSEPNAEYILKKFQFYKNKNNFDYIVCLWNTINQLNKKDRKTFIKNSFNNLKDGGKLILTTQHRYNSPRIFLKQLIQGREQREYYYQEKEINDWFNKTDFDVSINNLKFKGLFSSMLLIIAEKPHH